MIEIQVGEGFPTTVRASRAVLSNMRATGLGRPFEYKLIKSK